MGPVARVIRWAIWLYQATISPLFPGQCRYWPSCSAYARQAVRDHGAIYGSWLGFRRILRCNPFGGWGYDPVPPKCTHEHGADGDAPACGRPLAN